jgi:hypothetical protein
MHLLTRPVGRPPKRLQVLHASFTYQAPSKPLPNKHPAEHVAEY